jgi:hypothetical protein
MLAVIVVCLMLGTYGTKDPILIYYLVLALQMTNHHSKYLYHVTSVARASQPKCKELSETEVPMLA